MEMIKYILTVAHQDAPAPVKELYKAEYYQQKSIRLFFEKVFAEYDLKGVLREIDSIKYPAYEDVKKKIYGVK